MVVSKETFRRMVEEAKLEVLFIQQGNPNRNRARLLLQKIESIWNQVQERNSGNGDQLLLVQQYLDGIRIISNA